MKLRLRYVLAAALAIVVILFYHELMAIYDFVVIWQENCFVQKRHPRTCAKLAALAQMQYTKYEGAAIETAKTLMDPHRWIDFAPIAFIFIGAAFTIRKCRKTTTDSDFDDDILAWLE